MTQTQPDALRTDFRTESRTFTWATPGQGDPRQLMALDGTQGWVGSRSTYWSKLSRRGRLAVGS